MKIRVIGYKEAVYGSRKVEVHLELKDNKNMAKIRLYQIETR